MAQAPPPPPPPPPPLPPPPPAAPASEDTAEEGDLRLVGRVDINGFATGAVQVFSGGAFGAVCGQDFGDPEARVACRQLGFPSGTVLRSVFGRDGFANSALPFIAPFVLSALGCTGAEERLVDCPLAIESDYPSYPGAYVEVYETPEVCVSGGSTSTPPSYATVACGFGTGAEEGNLRLADGVTADDGGAQWGRLEIFSDGGWGTVCGFDYDLFDEPVPFTATSATVACRQLGFTDAGPVKPGREQGIFGSTQPEGAFSIFRRVPIVLPGADCAGTEARLVDCPRPKREYVSRTGIRLCSHGDDVRLTCFNGPPSIEDGSLRLAEGARGPGFEWGRLELSLNGIWNDICSEWVFTPNSAALACRLLGFDGGSRLLFQRPSDQLPQELYTVLPASRPVALADVDCDGTEASLLECSARADTTELCVNSTAATVVACGDTASAPCSAAPPVEEGSVRLVDGLGTPCDPLHTGTVEIFHTGEWGAICVPTDPKQLLVSPPDYFAADAICRQLGFPHGSVIDTFNPEPVGEYSSRGYLQFPVADLVESQIDGRVWLRGLQCAGREDRVLDCELQPPGFVPDAQTCFGAGAEDGVRLAVACRQFPVDAALEAETTPGAEEGDIRLVDERRIGEWVTGTPQVFFEGSWSQVCGALFDVADATVACRQLGHGAASFDTDVGTRSVGLQFQPRGLEVEPEVAITRSGCAGTEARLFDCPLEPATSFAPRCRLRIQDYSDDEELRIACVAEPTQGTEGDVRLGAPLEEVEQGLEGVLEIFHAGAWGSLCEVSSTGEGAQALTVAQVVCRQLGFQNGQEVTPTFDAPAGEPVSPLWLQRITCDGTEAAVSDCARTQFGATSGFECSGGGAPRIRCTNEVAEDGAWRLVGGSADPGGAWEYGRLEVGERGMWTTVQDGSLGNPEFGSLEEACAALGFAAGAHIVVDGISPLPREQDSLTSRDAVLVCSNPSGCTPDGAAAPAEGDVRLVPIAATATPTATCDSVHFGGVEIFTDGVWMRICNGESFYDYVDNVFPVVAQVVCRQLGFSFGGIMEAGSAGASSRRENVGNGEVDDYVDLTAGVPVAANIAKCSGAEARLADCLFGESDTEDFFPLGEVEEYIGGPVDGECRSDLTRMFAVVCRQFPILGSDLIR